MPFPEQIYRGTAVAGRTDEWVERYHRVQDTSAVSTMLASEEPPSWLSDDTAYDAWDRTRHWMIEHATATSDDGRFILMVLWDGTQGGWISELVRRAESLGAEIKRLSTAALADATGGRS